MQIVQNVFKAILVFCLSLVIMFSIPLSAEASSCYSVNPTSINFEDCPYQNGYYECVVTSSPEFASFDLLFNSYESNQETISLVIDRSGPEKPEDIKNIDVPGNGFIPEKGVFADAAPSGKFIARSSHPSNIYMSVLDCQAEH